MSREFLLIKLVCTNCGKNLQMTSGMLAHGNGQYAEGEPTGADMVHTTVGVHPCSCQTQQLEQIRQAAKTLLGQAA